MLTKPNSLKATLALIYNQGAFKKADKKKKKRS